MTEARTAKAGPSTKPPDNPLISLLLNIVVPSFILMEFSEKHRMGPVGALVAALSIPLVYGAYDWIRRREFNLFSMLGTMSVVFTGSLGLIQAGAIWIALKEASFSLFFAGAFLVTARRGNPLIRVFLMSPDLVDVAAIEHSLKKRSTQGAFEKLLYRCSLVMAGSMVLCAILSFSVAMFILKSEPGTVAFGKELGKMTLLSFPVAGVPALMVLLAAFWMLVRGLKKLTGLETGDIFNPR